MYHDELFIEIKWTIEIPDQITQLDEKIFSQMKNSQTFFIALHPFLKHLTQQQNFLFQNQEETTQQIEDYLKKSNIFQIQIKRVFTLL